MNETIHSIARPIEEPPPDRQLRDSGFKNGSQQEKEIDHESDPRQDQDNGDSR